MHTARLTFNDSLSKSQLEITINKTISSTKAFINLQDLIDPQHHKVALLHHNGQDTITLNLTGVTPYIVLFFNDTLNFAGATHSMQYGNGTFQLQTQYPWILLLQLPHQLNLSALVSFKLLDQPSSINNLQEDVKPQQNFKPGYGQFPYFILKVGYAIYMQIPIHFIGPKTPIDTTLYPGTQIRVHQPVFLEASLQEKIAALQTELKDRMEHIITKLQNHKNQSPELCLVTGPKQALYYKNGSFNKSQNIPSAGTLVDQAHNILAMNSPHYINTL